jgi:hypothetical protein
MNSHLINFLLFLIIATFSITSNAQSISLSKRNKDYHRYDTNGTPRSNPDGLSGNSTSTDLLPTEISSLGKFNTPRTSRWGIGVGWSIGGDDEDTLMGGGFNAQVLFWNKVAMELFFSGYDSLHDDDVYDYVRTMTTWGIAGLYFPGQEVTDNGFYPYMRLGYLFKSNDYFRSTTADNTYRTETAFNWEIGVGIQWRFSTSERFGLSFSLNAEVKAVVPNSSELDDDKSSVILFCTKFMIHF